MKFNVRFQSIFFSSKIVGKSYKYCLYWQELFIWKGPDTEIEACGVMYQPKAAMYFD